jgi:hypothetical protein
MSKEQENMKEKDVTHDEQLAFCDCVVEEVKKVLSVKEYVSLAQAVVRKGEGGLDKEAKKLNDKSDIAVEYCVVKIVKVQKNSTKSKTNLLNIYHLIFFVTPDYGPADSSARQEANARANSGRGRQ